MLVLSRKLGESIQIGSQITVTILEVQGNRVKIGIEAPADCRILRGELAHWPGSEAEARPVASPARAGASRTQGSAWVEMPSSASMLAAVR